MSKHDKRVKICPSMTKELKLGWTVYETIGIGIINPRAARMVVDPFASEAANIRDFCYEHSSPVEMRKFAGDMLIKHPTFAHRIKDEILKICPQYKDMLDKIVILV